MTEVWLAFDSPEDEEASHEANVYADDNGFYVEWSHTAVGQVTSQWFPTRRAAHTFLTEAGYADFTA